MKTPRIFWSAFVSCLLLALPILVPGCSRPTVDTGQPAPTQLSSTDAAQLAAKLANGECERLFKRRPFEAGQYPAILRDGEYHWGVMDPGARGGYSAEVSFRPDGSQPSVQVYFSTDKLSPLRSSPRPNN